ncbi:YggT family protein [bacterium]|nr:YggT family protein [bacterium]
MISLFIQIVFSLLYLILLLVILASWIPIFNTRKEPFATLVKIYSIVMAPFKAIIPTIGGLDFSPILAFIVLQLLENLILRILVPLGL